MERGRKGEDGRAVVGLDEGGGVDSWRGIDDWKEGNKD